MSESILFLFLSYQTNCLIDVFQINREIVNEVSEVSLARNKQSICRQEDKSLTH